VSLPQILKQGAKGWASARPPAKPLSSGSDEFGYPLFIHQLNSDLPPSQPSAKAGDEPEFLCASFSGVPLLEQKFCKAIYVWSERTRAQTVEDRRAGTEMIDHKRVFLSLDEVKEDNARIIPSPKA